MDYKNKASVVKFVHFTSMSYKSESGAALQRTVHSHSNTYLKQFILFERKKMKSAANNCCEF